MKRLLFFVCLLTSVSAYAATRCVALNAGTAGVGLSNPEGQVAWSVTEANGIKVSGLGLCSSTVASTQGQTATTMSVTGTGNHYCWCKMVSPVESKWVFYLYYVYVDECASRCNYRCGDFVHDDAVFRGAMFNAIIK